MFMLISSDKQEVKSNDLVTHPLRQCFIVTYERAYASMDVLPESCH